MKRQIRRNVFETNSSSAHSLTVMRRDDKCTTDEILDKICLCRDEETGEEDCVWDIWNYDDLNFGRSPFRPLYTFADKWLYACASLVRSYNDDIYKKLVELALKYIPGLKKIKLPTTTDFFPDKNDKEHKDDDHFQRYGKTEDELVEYLAKKEKDWGMEVDYWKTSGGYWKYRRPFTGYVDEDILSGFLEKEGISLEEYLISKKYVVIQDGDEYCYYSDMKKTGLIDMDMIDHEYPTEDW